MRNHAGMTLIEMLIALALTGIITSAGYSVFATAIDTRERTRDVMEPVSKASAARGLIMNWLGAAHVTGREDGVEFVGVDATESSVVDVVTFLTNDARPLTTGPATIRLSIDTDSTTRERGLVADAWYGMNKHRRMNPLPEATILNIEYFGEVEGLTRWWPSWQSAVRLPAAVRVSIAASDSVRTVSGIPIVVLLDPSQ